MRISGHLFPNPSHQWEPFFEEIFFHTSRYFSCRLKDLLEIAGKPCSKLYDFNAAELNAAQRFVLAWMMTDALDKAHARNLLSVLEIFHDLEKSKHLH